jgi:2-amino-4-hydroxy-6-hydroxymethyldihydropteridine diphosphokinase
MSSRLNEAMKHRVRAFMFMLIPRNSAHLLLIRHPSVAVPSTGSVRPRYATMAMRHMENKTTSERCSRYRQRLLMTELCVASAKHAHSRSQHEQHLSQRLPVNERERYLYRVYVAVGSNEGDRFLNIQRSVKMLDRTFEQFTGGFSNASLIRLIRTSFLYETTPMYFLDQSPFLNGVIEIWTNMPPEDLLLVLKGIESILGRDLDNPVSNGPRPIDLDILLYFRRKLINENIDSDHLLLAEDYGEPLCFASSTVIVPHPRLHERNFVLSPLLDIAGMNCPHPTLETTIGALRNRLLQCSESLDTPCKITQVLPLRRNRLLYWNATLVMGILNRTPDSFSDGGSDWSASVEAAAMQALSMVNDQGAHVVDIGGESTRPGAEPISLEEELRRTIPLIRRIRQGV